MYNFPKSITSEKDLDVYKNYLDKNFPKTNTSGENGFLSRYTGKTVKIEMNIGNRTEIKIGILTDVYGDCIVLSRPRESFTMLCKYDAVKCITVMQSN